MSNATSEWKLVWADEFDDGEGEVPNRDRWKYDIGRGPTGNGWGNEELQYYTDSARNAFQDGRSHLVIRAIREDHEGQPYTSARLVSHNDGSWLYGKVEVRAKLPKGGRGIWPAIWMLPTDWAYGGWPMSGEIDIMEMIGSEPQRVWGTLHFGVPHKYINDSFDLPDTDFHTYGVIWEPDAIHWLIDDKVYETRKVNEWYSSAGESPAPFDKRFHVLLNLAVGGHWPGYPDETVEFPQEFLIDYVRVYQRTP